MNLTRLLAPFVLILSLPVLSGCDGIQDLPMFRFDVDDHRDAVGLKYKRIESNAKIRPENAGVMRSNKNGIGYSSSALLNGRVVHTERVWVNDDDAVTYVAYSFMNDTVLTQGTLNDDHGAAVTEVWRHHDDEWCPILAFQSDGTTPMLPFSSTSAKSWTEVNSGQVTYRLFVGTAEGAISKISFKDTHPTKRHCGSQITTEDGASGYFTQLNLTDAVAPVTGMRLVEFEPVQATPIPAQPDPMSNKRVLVWWGNVSNCTPLDGSKSCPTGDNGWEAVRASAMLLVNGSRSKAYDGPDPHDYDTSLNWQSWLNSGNQTRAKQTKTGDVDLRLRYDATTRNLNLALAIAYETFPYDGKTYTDYNNQFPKIANIHTRSDNELVSPDDDGDIIQLLRSFPHGPTFGDQHWAYAAGPIATYNATDPATVRYSANSSVRIVDQSDPSKISVAITNYGDKNATGICPILGNASVCVDTGYSNSGSLFVTYGGLMGNAKIAPVEVADVYKGWGFDSVSLSAGEVTDARIPGLDSNNRGIVIFEPGKPQVATSKAFISVASAGGPLSDFSSKVPYDLSENYLFDGMNISNLRVILAPDVEQDPNYFPRIARVYVLASVADNVAYNSPKDGVGNIEGGVVMCTGQVDMISFVPPKAWQPTGRDLIKNLDCTQEWNSSRDSGYKFASAKQVVLNGTNGTSPAMMNIKLSPTYDLHLTYVSTAGGIFQIEASDADTKWKGQASWTMLSAGRSAECHNILVKPPVPPAPKAQPFWKRALTRVMTGGFYGGGDFRVAFEKNLSELTRIGADAACEDLGPIAAACGIYAGAYMDALIDAVDSKARSEQAGPDYKKLYDQTHLGTACTGG